MECVSSKYANNQCPNERLFKNKIVSSLVACDRKSFHSICIHLDLTKYEFLIDKSHEADYAQCARNCFQHYALNRIVFVPYVRTSVPKLCASVHSSHTSRSKRIGHNFVRFVSFPHHLHIRSTVARSHRERANH